MRFHIPSFFVGFAAGYGAKTLAPRIRPVLLELATAGFKVANAMRAQASRRREDLEDLWAEAKARVHGDTGGATPH